MMPDKSSKIIPVKFNLCLPATPIVDIPMLALLTRKALITCFFTGFNALSSSASAPQSE